MLLHFVSILLPVISLVIKDPSTRMLLFWSFNLLCPSINAQVLITDLLVKNSRFCQLASLLFSGAETDLFKPIGDQTIVWNVVILIGHCFLCLLMLIGIDRGLLQFSLACFYRSNFEEQGLDADVLAERHRVLAGAGNNEQLVVNDLVKFYPIRRVLAVDHLTFGVKQGEAFGLLGYNVSRTASIDR